MNTFRQDYLQRRFTLPNEHGAWVFVLSPLIIGIYASGQFSVAMLLLIIAVMSAFLLRQPASMAIKSVSGRRPKRDLSPAIFWSSLYGMVCLASVIVLVINGFTHILILAAAGIPVFIWHLWLISKRQERRQMGIEIVGSGVLALAAPAAFWVGAGGYVPQAWWLFALTWLQSAASIVYAYLRLEQREWPEVPVIPSRFRAGHRAILYTTFNLIFSITGSLLKLISPFLWIPFLLQWGETMYGCFYPAVAVKPTRIGFRQLTISTLFTILFIFTW